MGVFFIFLLLCNKHLIIIIDFCWVLVYTISNSIIVTMWLQDVWWVR